jgi:heme-degrading monooxygenase HmoA
VVSDGFEGEKAKFVRVWRGRTSHDKANACETYWLQNGVEPLKRRGAISVQIMRHDGPLETEFVTFSYWGSLEAMTGGSESDPTDTHHLDRDAEFLLELPKKVQVLKILASG